MDYGASSTVSNSSTTKHPSSPSMSNQKLKDSNRIPKWNSRTNTNDIVQNFLSIWLDAKIDESNSDYLNSIKQLRQAVNTIEIFRDTDECIDHISDLQNEKLFLIISDVLCQTVVPLIHNMTQLYSIYIFSQKQHLCEKWRKDLSKVKGIYTEITSICDAVHQSTRQCDEDSIVISVVSSLNQIEPHLCTQSFSKK
ncbi:unnamed protein product [Rotaria sp. Silwood1]|nr:unnamed protein product [Rotaria sp. Silwood1]